MSRGIAGSIARGQNCRRVGFEQVAPESGDAECADHDTPDREEEPAGVGKKRIGYHDWKNLRCARRLANTPRACYDGLLVPRRSLLLRRSWRLLVHALLDPGLVIGFHLLELGFLVRGQQLIELVVDARLLHGKSGLDLRFLRG